MLSLIKNGIKYYLLPVAQMSLGLLCMCIFTSLCHILIKLILSYTNNLQFLQRWWRMLHDQIMHSGVWARTQGVIMGLQGGRGI